MLLTSPPAVQYMVFAVVFIVAQGAISYALRRTGHGGRLILASWAFLLISLVPGWFLTQGAEEAERSRLRDSITGFAPTYADEMKKMGHHLIQLDTPPDDPLYLAMIERQKEWLRLNPKVSDIYTFRPGEDGNILIVDSETDYNRDGVYDPGGREKRTKIGTVWPEESALLDGAYAGTAGFDDEPYEDAWGTWVSAYVPMLDEQGRVEAVLGVDYDANEWVLALGRARSLALGLLAVFLVSVIGLITVISVLRANLRQRRRASDRTRQIVDQAHDAFVTMDEQGRIVDWNPQSTAVFGWTREEAIGRRVVDLLMPDRFRAAHVAGVKRYLDTGEAHVVGRRIDVTGLHRDGHEFPLEMTITALQQGGSCRFHAFLHDISDRLAREEQLRVAKEGAEAATRAKNEFIASVSHEIRTPMNGILGMCELIDNTALDEQQREYLVQMKRSSDSLLHLLNDVLDMSKIEAGKVEIEARPFDLHGCIEAVTLSQKLHAEAKGLALEWAVEPDVPPILVGDSARLGQVLSNLLGNAIKFTEEGTVAVAVQREASRRGEGHVFLRFSVRDTGIGIARDKQESIFDAFRQEDASTTRRYGGTGLGLSICRHLVGLMGGTMSLQSEPGAGSTFHFTARFGIADAAALAAERAGGRGRPEYVAPADLDLPGLRILLVEDGLINQQVATGLLELEGHEVTVAEDGRKGLEAWREGSFDLILMDLHMPVMGGLEATRTIRAEEPPGPHRIPIIALTAMAMKGDRDRCLAAGMDAYIAKPIDRLELRDRIRALVCRRQPAPAERSSRAGERGVVDWGEARRHIPGGEDRLRTMAALMETEGPRLLEEIRRGVAAGDAGRVVLSAHTLKGSAAHFGAEEVVRVAADAEASARQDDLVEALGAALAATDGTAPWGTA
jgi:PAS domain S-box-containing protein